MPFPGCLQKAQPGHEGALDQQTPVGGQFPEKQIAFGPSVSYRLILNLGTCPGRPVLFQYVTLTPAVEEGTSSSALCHAPQLCTCVIDEPCASSFSVHGAPRERLVHAFPVALLRPEFFIPIFGFFFFVCFLFFCPVNLSLFPLLSWCWGLNPVSCACQSCALPLSYTCSQSSTLLCDALSLSF